MNNVHNLSCCRGIQRTGHFIPKKNIGLIDHCSANGGSLKLSSRNLVDIPFRNVGDPHFLHEISGSFHNDRTILCPKLKGRIDNIIYDGKILQKAGLLEHEAHAFQSKLLHFLLGQGCHINSIKIHCARSPLIHCTDAV